MDKLAALCIFRHAVELNNFLKVGERLNLSQSVISKTIRQLEEELKTRLFNRTTRRISLTESGEKYYIIKSLVFLTISIRQTLV